MTYKQVVKNTVTKMATTEVVWQILQKTVLPFTHLVVQERARLGADKEPVQRKTGALVLAEKAFADRRVRHGPFRGMEYPDFVALGSALIPKLLGSYESEIAPLVETLVQIPYDRVLDIGAAEGYYAVGFAIRMPATQISAFDTNEEARMRTAKMADLNNVKVRVTVESTCTVETLSTLNPSERILIFCDCDGCEKYLFTPETAQKLQTAEVLIEVHDFMDLSISGQLRDAFRATHDLLILESIDDVRKARTYRFPEMENASQPEKRILVFEFRPGIQEWYFFMPKFRAGEFRNIPGTQQGNE